jgi:hypothetical protein
MGTVRVTRRIDGPIFNAEELWYDLARWPAFMDGFDHVASVGPEWPRHGTLTWDSRTGGRERVIEDVLWFSPREGQDVAVEDPKLTGVQRVRFRPGTVTLELEYRLKESMWLVDLLVIRRRLRESMTRTLRRFAIELRADAELVDS